MYGLVLKVVQMEMSVDRRMAQGNRPAKPVAPLGRWTRDARRPSIRLTPAEVPPPPPDVTAPFQIVQPPARPVIALRPISSREATPFMARTTACPFLECRSTSRRCLSAYPAPVSLERQVRYCLKTDHRTCKYYRKARGLAAVPPTQAAFYTGAFVSLVLLALMLGAG